MTAEQRQAYEWAKNQSCPSVAARYAKLLAEAVDGLQAEVSALKVELFAVTDGPCDSCKHKYLWSDDPICMQCLEKNEKGDALGNWEVTPQPDPQEADQ